MLSHCRYTYLFCWVFKVMIMAHVQLKWLLEKPSRCYRASRLYTRPSPHEALWLLRHLVPVFLTPSSFLHRASFLVPLTLMSPGIVLSATFFHCIHFHPHLNGHISYVEDSPFRPYPWVRPTLSSSSPVLFFFFFFLVVPRSMGDLSPPPGIEPTPPTPCGGSTEFNHWTTREVPSSLVLMENQTCPLGSHRYCKLSHFSH